MNDADQAGMTIAESWRTYLERVVPKQAGPEQLSETRDSFYAGFASALYYFQRIGEDDVSEEQALTIMQGLDREQNAFLEEIKKRPMPRPRVPGPHRRRRRP